MTDGVAPTGDGIALPISSPYTYAYLLHLGGIGRIALATKDRNGRFCTRLLAFEDCLGAMNNLDNDRDCYLSPNAFRRGRHRRNKDVISIRATWVDLDYYRSGMAGLSAGEVWEKALSLLRRSGIPVPQMALSTGRGLQLLWVCPMGLPATCEPRWTAIQRALVELFVDFGPDPAANSLCGVLRLPGTINTKSGTLTYFVHLDMDTRTNFDDLSRAVTPLRRPKESKLHIRDARRRTVVNNSLLRVEENQKSAEAIVRDIERLVHGRGFGHEPRSSQDVTLFIFGHYLRRAVGREAFWEAFMHFADAMTGLPARKKRETAKSVLAFKGRFSSVGAAARLGVTEDEVEKYDLKRLLPAGAKNDKEQHERRLERRRQQQARSRRSKGQRPQTESIKAMKPWEPLGVSRATFYRHLKTKRS